MAAVSRSGSEGAGVGHRNLGGRRRGRRRTLLVVWVGDSELSGVLVLALVRAGVDDELDAVSGVTSGWLDVGGWGPDVAAVVLGALDDDIGQLEVGGRSLEEHEGDWTLGGWLPGDGEALTGGDDGVQVRLVDWVALQQFMIRKVYLRSAESEDTHLWLCAHWGGVCRCERHHAGQTGREEAEEGEVGHGECVVLFLVGFRGFGCGGEIEFRWKE